MSRGTFRVDLSTNNDAFEPDTAAEVVRILRALATRIEVHGTLEDGEVIRAGDINGARVGFAVWEAESVRGCSCGMADYGAPGHDGDPNGPGHRDVSEDGCWEDRRTGNTFHYCNALRGKVLDATGEVVDTFDPSV